MIGVKQIAAKVLVVLIDVFLLSYRILRQLALPTRKRKGNLLSSLFNLFAALIERLNCFEHGIFSMAAIFRKKYIKQCLLVVGGFLFILSLFEWSGGNILAAEKTPRSTALRHTSSAKEIVVAQSKWIDCNSKQGFVITTYDTFNNFFPGISVSVSPANKYLLLRCLRI